MDYNGGAAAVDISIAYDPDSEDFIYGQRTISDVEDPFETYTVDDSVEEVVGFGPGAHEDVLPVKLSGNQEAVASTSTSEGEAGQLPVMTVVETELINGDFDNFASSRSAQAICERNTITEAVPAGQIA